MLQLLKLINYVVSKSKSEVEKETMKHNPYASIFESLIYTHVCTRSDIAYVISLLGRFQANLGKKNRKAAKKVMRYLQPTFSSIPVIIYVQRNIQIQTLLVT